MLFRLSQPKEVASLRRFIKNARAALALCLLAAVALSSAACSGEPFGTGGGGGVVSGAGAARLRGAGSSFVNPLFQKWMWEYGELHPNISIDYQSIGSGGGIRQLQQRTVDFGATDIAMRDEDMRSSTSEIVHIPVVLGAVVVTYNLPGSNEPLRFSPATIADIFLGKITRWDDARLRADNPTANLPAAALIVVHRSDGSGTSAVFTDYLSKVSQEWRERVGSGTSPRWPTGIGGKGNEGVAGQIKQTPNTIGYIEQAYATQNNLPVAYIRNRAGNFVLPTFEAVTAAAAESIPETPEDLRVSITNAAGADAYPISSYVYVVIYREQRNPAKGLALVDFLWWGIHEGQEYTRPLRYSPLPAETVRRVEQKLNSITASGNPLRAAR